ncbi:MAG: Na/Pi cotransporter family protein [Lachnospiraceae bacterium]|nr:Na/Pi cotransporter family protein [Lachnospiraceae bacterium]
MDIFNALTMIGGLSLFLFGMTLMGQALERRAGSKLKMLLGRMTSNRFAGLLTGLGVTAIIQSSSATTVMVVGFVNSGLMTLKQAINVIMGANIGTTVTAWILSLAGISSKNVFIRLLKPSSFTPVLALIGIIFYMTAKNNKRRDTGVILLGFATLMFGMETMSDAVSGLREVPAFRQLFVAFSNPILGVLAGAVLTAVIQSSSASVGILQSLASTGAVSYGAAIPIIMGQNIGTCVTALISSVGTGKNARRAALVHLSFNVIGTAVWLTVFCLVRALLAPALLGESASLMGIAVAHSVFNILCTILMLPLSGFLEKLVCRMIPDTKVPDKAKELDERLLGSPSLALAQCKMVLDKMAVLSVGSLKSSMNCIFNYEEEAAEEIRRAEEETDHLEDIISTYLLQLTAGHLSREESVRTTEYMKLVGDYERIADHAVNILESAEEIGEKNIEFTEEAAGEYRKICNAVNEILDLSYKAFSEKNYGAARKTEPLEQVIDTMKETLRTRHILRLQKGECTVAAGFVWSDLLTNLERTADHCSNISGCVLDTLNQTMNIHERQSIFRNSDEDFKQEYRVFERQYSL